MSTTLFDTMTGAGACSNTPGVADPDWRTNVSERTCSVEGCERTSRIVRGLCPMHYRRWMRSGDAGSAASTHADRRSWPLNPFVVITKIVVDDSGCWRWQGAKDRAGYGKVTCQVNGRPSTVGAHRFSYMAFVGPIPEGLTLDHLCRVVDCVNPAHLEPVTFRTNVLRGRTLPAANLAKTHCPRGHAYDEANTRIRPDRSRECRTCKRERRARERLAVRERRAS